MSGIGKKDNPLPEYKVRHETGIERRHFETVIPGMVAAVEAGTVMGLARIADIKIAGKTGTSQTKRGKAHAIFIGFAPAENPKIAIAVFVENGEWGGISAAPVANLVIERYLKGKTENKALENYVLTTKRFLPFPPAQKPKQAEKDTTRKKDIPIPLADKKANPATKEKAQTTSAGR